MAESTRINELVELNKKHRNTGDGYVEELAGIATNLLDTLIDVSENAKDDSPEMWLRVDAVIAKAMGE